MTEPGPRRDRDADPDGLVLPSQRRSVALLRRYAADACTELGWDSSSETVGLLVSELSTDAVVRQSGDRIRVRVLDRGLRLRVEVSTLGDAAPVAQRRTPPDAEQEAGLVVVEAAALAWGTGSGPEGSTAWFELGV